MLAGTALYVRLLVYAGLSLFSINGLYVYMVACVVYAYNLTQPWCEFLGQVGCHLLATRLVSQLRSDVTPNSATLSSYIGLEPGFTPLVGIWKPYKNT